MPSGTDQTLAIASLIFAVLVMGCTTEDGPEYDVPARRQVGNLQMDVDADGTPVILADIAMNFGTTEKRREWDPLFMNRNTQTVAYTLAAGKWESHGFRNLTTQYVSEPFLARNAEGGLQALVWDQQRLSLYARKGSDWVVRHTRRLPDLESQSFNWGFSQDSRIALVGDSGWNAITPLVNGHGSELRDNGGLRMPLDSGFNFTPLCYLSGRERIGAVGLEYMDSQNPSGAPPDLVWFEWSSDFSSAAPRRTLIEKQSGAYFASFVSVGGRIRLWTNSSMDPDKMALWDKTDTGFTVKEYLTIPHSRNDSLGGPAGEYGPLALDGQGCMHKLAITGGYDSRIGNPGQPPTVIMIHRSSCGETGDTLNIPSPPSIHPVVITTQVFRAGPDGTLSVAVVLTENLDMDQSLDWRNHPVPGSWIACAMRRPGEAWEYRQVAAF